MNPLDADLNRADLYTWPSWDSTWYAKLGNVWYRVPDQPGGWRARAVAAYPLPRLRKLSTDGQRKLKRRLNPVDGGTP